MPVLHEMLVHFAEGALRAVDGLDKRDSWP